MELLVLLGERVRRQRMARGLTQTELANQTGIPIPNLSRIEHGRQSNYIERLIDLAKTLNVSADYLLGLTDDPTPPKKPQRSRKTAPVG
jgi:transcriptional regulator with XRE-family HTH domain